MPSLAAARAPRLRGPARGVPPIGSPGRHLVSPRTPGTRPPRILVPDVGGCLRPHLPTVGMARGCHHGDHPRGPAQAGGGRPVSVHPGADVDPSRPHGGAGAEASRGVRTSSTGATSGARRGRLSLPRWPSPSARCSHAPDGSGARSNGTSLLTRVEDEPPRPVTRRVRDVVLDDPAGQVATRRSTPPHCAPPTSARVFLGARSPDPLRPSFRVPRWLGCGPSAGIRRRASPDGTPGNASSGPHRRG
jgi:hypothetical protein